MSTFRKDSLLGLNFNLISSTVSPTYDSYPSLSNQKPNLVPYFPGAKQNAIQKAASQGRAQPNNPNSPQNLPKQASLGSLGLFPMQSAPDSTGRTSPIGKIGIPFAKLTVEKISYFSRPNSVKKLPRKSPERNISPSELQLLKKVSSKEIAGTPKKADQLHKKLNLKAKSLFQKLQTGRASVDNLSESDLLQVRIDSFLSNFFKLAIDAVTKPKSQRVTLDIAILRKCLANVDFFKEQEPKALESLYKALSHCSLKSGEVVYTRGKRKLLRCKELRIFPQMRLEQICGFY